MSRFGYTLSALKRRSETTGAPQTDLAAALVVAVFVLWLFVATAVSIMAWAALHVALGVFPAFEEALYFSTVTMTTVGYGDLVVARNWRLLAGIQAVNGSFLFGWSTALVFSLVEATYRMRQSR